MEDKRKDLFAAGLYLGDVTLVLADTELDLSMRQADVAVRMTPPRQPDLAIRTATSQTLAMLCGKLRLDYYN